MTEKQAMLRRQLLSKIHTHKRYKELKASDAWETFLDCHFKICSSAKLSIKELYTCLDLLNGTINSVEEIDLRGRELISRKKKAVSSFAQANRIKELMKIIGWDELTLKKFIIKQLKIIADPFKMNVKNSSKLIYILEKIAKAKDKKA
ncbi:hypothetical protein [Campylobacter hyointestinalis]|uniref:hypothetical protein n=1 Tax=Campylobacter hyointestinalis TaxID=198 RepID=UPI000727F6C0|nr:hypothetical protein [Campylobacter hyointestinalis]CUU79962.1 Uncharacterised protein [Campylobacter hyointestinalis subsp. hyointestinalis]